MSYQLCIGLLDFACHFYLCGPLGDRTLHSKNVSLISKGNLCLAVSLGNYALQISERDLCLALRRRLSCQA